MSTLLLNFWEFFSKKAYLIFLGLSVLYLIFYSVYFLNDGLNSYLCEYEKLIEYTEKIAILTFTAGIFSASIKYIQFLGIFRDEVKSVVMSKEFDASLSEQVKKIALSEDFLIKQSNLNEIWERVTLCKYKQRFPELGSKLIRKIDNAFFNKDNIEYYYKNWQVSYNIVKVDSKIIEVEEKSTFTVVRPDTKKFIWDMGVVHLASDPDPELDYSVNNIEDTLLNKELKTTPPDSLNQVKITLKTELSGHLEYHFTRTIKLTQNIKNDRVFSFFSLRIIDDLTLNIKHCSETGVYVEGINEVKLYPNNTSFDGTWDVSLINRDIFLPGEKFKIFIFFK